MEGIFERIYRDFLQCHWSTEWWWWGYSVCCLVCEVGLWWRTKPCEAKRSELSQNFEGRVGTFKRDVGWMPMSGGVLGLLGGSNLRRGPFCDCKGLQSSCLGARNGVEPDRVHIQRLGRGAGGTSVSDCGNFVGHLVFFRTIGCAPYPLETPQRKTGVCFVLYELYCIAYVVWQALGCESPMTRLCSWTRSK